MQDSLVSDTSSAACVGDVVGWITRVPYKLLVVDQYLLERQKVRRDESSRETNRGWSICGGEEGEYWGQALPGFAPAQSLPVVHLDNVPPV